MNDDYIKENKCPSFKEKKFFFLLSSVVIIMLLSSSFNPMDFRLSWLLSLQKSLLKTRKKYDFFFVVVVGLIDKSKNVGWWRKQKIGLPKPNRKKAKNKPKGLCYFFRIYPQNNPANRNTKHPKLYCFPTAYKKKSTIRIMIKM